jgi:hypothetical protein
MTPTIRQFLDIGGIAGTTGFLSLAFLLHLVLNHAQKKLVF